MKCVYCGSNVVRWRRGGPEFENEKICWSCWAVYDDKDRPISSRPDRDRRGNPLGVNWPVESGDGNDIY